MPVTEDEVAELLGESTGTGVTEAEVAQLLGEAPAAAPASAADLPANAFSQAAPVHLGRGLNDAFERVPTVDAKIAESRYSAEQARKAERIRSLMDGLAVTTAEGVDRQASILKLATDTKMRTEVAAARFDELAKWRQLAKHDPVMWMNANPELTELLLERPELAPVVLRDRQTNALSRAYNWAKDHGLIDIPDFEDLDLDEGKRLREKGMSEFGAISELRRKASEKRDAPKKEELVDDEQAKEVREGEWQLFADGVSIPKSILVPGYRFSEGWQQMQRSRVGYELLLARARGDDGIADQLQRRALDLKHEAVRRDYQEGEVGRVFSSAATAAASSAYGLREGGVLGIAAGLVAGGGALVLGKNPAAAGKVALSAAALFGKAGAVKGTFELEAGSFYLEALETKDVNGKPIDERTARAAAAVYGVLAAGVEFASWGPMLKALGPVGHMIQSGEVRAVTRAMLASAGFRRAMKTAAKNWLPAAGAEGGEEWIQDGLEQALMHFAKGGGFKDFDYDEERGKEAAGEGFFGGLGIGGAAVTTGLVTAAIERDVALRNGKIVEDLAGLEAGPATRAAPTAVADMVKKATAKSGEPVTALHVDAEEFVRLYQSQNADPDEAVRELMGEEGPKKLKDALETGQRLEVPIAQYLERWGGTETAKRLVDATSTSATAPLLVDVEETQERIEQLAKEVDAEAPQSEAEAAFIASTEASLEQAQGEGRNAAREQMNLWRAVVRTLGAKSPGLAEKMFEDLRVMVEAGEDLDLSVPEASEQLAEQLAGGKFDRAAAAFVDPLSGLRHSRAFAQQPVPEGKRVAVLTTTDIKPVNDDQVAGGHDAGNELLRAIGVAVSEGHEEAARSGTNFFVHVADQAELDQLLERARARVGQGVSIVGSLERTRTGETGDRMKAATEADKENTKKLREAGTLEPRGKPSKGLDVGALKFAPGRAAGVAPAELAAAANKLEARDFFSKYFITEGLLTAEGRAALPRKKHQLAMDLRGLKTTNDVFGEKWGDRMLSFFKRAMVLAGAGDVNGCHLSGDEFVAESDDLKQLEVFQQLLEEELGEIELEAEPLSGGGPKKIPVRFRYGFGLTYGEADRDLNTRRVAQERLAERGVGEAENEDLQARKSDLGRGEGTRSPGRRDRRANAQGLKRGRAQAFPRTNAPASATEQLGDAKKVFAGGKTEKGFTELKRKEAQKLFKVVLNKEADLSTFLHESGHIFLKLMSQAAMDPAASEQMRLDWAATLKWLGADNFASLTTEQHEKFATGFERYLLEGNAPSVRLVQAFERFRLWLIDVYRTAKRLAQLAPINDDIRGVFDRLLATDDEIRRQKSAMGMERPMARDLFKTDLDYQKYLEDWVAATQHAQRQAELTTAKEKLREQEAWFKDARRKMTEMVEDEYEHSRARQAQLTLQGKGELWGNTPSGAIVLDRDRVIAAIGEVEAKKVKNKKGGVDPDEVASFLGFQSGKQLLEAVATLPKKADFVKAEVDSIMAERYGDVLLDRQRLKDLVGKGLHGNMTAQLLLKERAALMTKAGAGVAAPVDVIRARAKKMVEERGIGRLDAGAALAAERKAANESATAAAKGNFARALIMKEKQLLNMFLWRELLEAREQREDFLELAGKLGTEKYRQRLAKGHPVYLGGSDFILEQLQLKEPSPREKPRPSIPEVVEQLDNDNETVGFDELIVNTAMTVGEYKNLTVEQMRHVHAALKNIKAAARNKATLLVDGQRMAKEDAIAKLLKEAKDNLPPKPPPPTKGAATPSQWAGGKWNAIDGEMRKPEFLLNQLGGRDTNSAWHRFIVKQLQAAKHLEADLWEEYGRPLLEVFQKMPTARAMEMIPGEKYFPGHTTKAARPQRRFELLVMLMHATNESNLERLTLGRGITEQELRDAAIAEGITDEECDWIQETQNVFEKLGVVAFDLEERDSGLRPEKIQPREWRAPSGKKYSGGYMPAVYQADTTTVGAKQAEKLMDQSGYVRPGTAHGHLKGRVEGFTDVLELSPQVILQHVAQVIHDIAYRERLKSVANLLLDDDVQAVMRERLGAGKARIFRDYLVDIGWMRGAERSKVPQIAGAMRWVRGNLMSVLGYSLPNALEDYATNITTACIGTGLKAKYLAAAYQSVKAYDRAAMAEAEELIPELRARREQVQRDLLKEQAKLTQFPFPGRKLIDAYKEHRFVFNEVADRATGAIIGLAAMRQYLAEHAAEENEDRLEADAVTFANAVVRKVMVSHSVVDQSALMRDKALAGAFLVFFGFFNHAYNRQADMVDQAVEAETGKARAKVLGEALGFMMAVFVFGSIIRGQGPDDGDEPEDAASLSPAMRRALKFRNYAVRKTLVGTAELFPVLGPIAQLAEGAYLGKKNQGVRNNSIVGIFEGVFKSWAKALDGDTKAKDALKAALKTLEPVLGIPVSGPLRTIGFLWDWYDGEAQPRGPGDVAGGVVYGRRRNQAGNPGTMLQDLAQ